MPPRSITCSPKRNNFAAGARSPGTYMILHYFTSGHYLRRAGAGQFTTQGRAYIVTMETKTHSASAFPNICKIRLKCNGSRSPSLQTVLCLPEAEGYTRATYNRSARRISAGVCFRTLPACLRIHRTISHGKMFMSNAAFSANRRTTRRRRQESAPAASGCGG